ncbi:zinc carboxypeptidase A 1-like [Teleopsis dalmanni]|uniref:zinc carboxypeptidase A 1-like n=1 Tax=Teleopsis dalmanni TaxID=139649 RepID=UPI0018CE2433|nr:zinc carboxypeptidase A 1-like [Teleopsis dalmanni]
MSQNVKRFNFILNAVIFLLFLCITESENAAFCTKDDKCVEPYVNQARYDHYRMYYVELDSEEHVKLFQDLEEQSDSCTFYGHALRPKQKLTIMVAAHKVSDFADLLMTYKVKHRVLTYNFQEKIDKNMLEVKPKTTNLKHFGWKHYYHLETIYEWLEHVAEQYPQDVTLLNMGDSTEGLPIKGLKLFIA